MLVMSIIADMRFRGIYGVLKSIERLVDLFHVRESRLDITFYQLAVCMVTAGGLFMDMIFAVGLCVVLGPYMYSAGIGLQRSVEIL